MPASAKVLHPAAPDATPDATPAWAEVVTDATGHRALRCHAWFERGAVLTRFGAARIVGAPDRHTLQLDEQRHFKLSPGCLCFVNHGCDPNVAFDLARFELVALRSIVAGDELRCFYPATEWDMAEPFACRCGSPRCLGEVRGAALLDDDVLARAPLSPWVASRRGDGKPGREV